MTDEIEDRVPGITFYFKHSTMTQSLAGELFRLDLVLDCAVNDEELWKDIQGKFVAGHRIYSSNDFHTEVLTVIRSELDIVSKRNATLDAENARLKNEVAELERKLAAVEKPLADFARVFRSE